MYLAWNNTKANEIDANINNYPGNNNTDVHECFNWSTGNYQNIFIFKDLIKQFLSFTSLEFFKKTILGYILNNSEKLFPLYFLFFDPRIIHKYNNRFSCFPCAWLCNWQICDRGGGGGWGWLVPKFKFNQKHMLQADRTIIVCYLLGWCVINSNDDYLGITWLKRHICVPKSGGQTSEGEQDL